MHVAAATAVCAAAVIAVPENAVKTVLEWQASQAMPATGTWVKALEAVGDAPAASGIIIGW
jgi:hypothetical protein